MTLFTKIMNGELPSTMLHQDEHCVAFLDIQPQAPQHILVVPRKEITSLNQASEEDCNLLGHLLLTARDIAERQGLAAKGYRLVINTGKEGGQTVDHLHIHILGGRQLGPKFD